MTNEYPTSGFWDLTGKKALVIGADNPAGGAIARAYAEAGADVALCALTPDEAVMRARAVRRDIEAMGRRAPEYIMDVTLGKNVQWFEEHYAQDIWAFDLSYPPFTIGTPEKSWMDEVAHAMDDDALLARIAGEVEALCADFPAPGLAS